MVGLPKGSITDKQEAAMALANFLQESDGLRAKREYACQNTGCPGSYATPGCDYQNQRYYGRGYIQLSWCYNYKPASQDLYGNDKLVKDPDMVARDEQVAWDTAFWFWKTRVHSQAGVAEGKFGVTVRAINGGLECDGAHKDQARRRFAMYGQVRAAFGLQGNGDERGCYN
jgi:predicted chitinase